MDAKDAMNASADLSLFVLNQYISDLSDAELMMRPGPGCNHLAWQLGHLINSNASLLESVCPGKAPALPEGFAERHSKANCDSDDASQFATKDQYVELLGKVHEAVRSALAELSEGDLQGPSPEQFRKMFPTVADMFTLMGAHPLMHAGQFVVVRRAAGKPVLI